MTEWCWSSRQPGPGVTQLRHSQETVRSWLCSSNFWALRSLQLKTEDWKRWIKGTSKLQLTLPPDNNTHGSFYSNVWIWPELSKLVKLTPTINSHGMWAVASGSKHWVLHIRQWLRKTVLSKGESHLPADMWSYAPSAWNHWSPLSVVPKEGRWIRSTLLVLCAHLVWYMLQVCSQACLWFIKMSAAW